MKIAVGIVLYNPQIEILLKSISQLINLVQYIILIDNNSNNINYVKKKLKQFKKVYIIENNQNYGIAKALNQILDYSYKNQVDYVLTLDQDSILSERMFKYLLKYKNIKNAAIICPTIHDINKKEKDIFHDEYQIVPRCITSGSLMNLKICKEIGYFDEKMFIDYVDFDYCKRINICKKKIIHVSKSVLQHELGKRTRKKFLWINVYPTNHSSERVYYQIRNMRYYYLKFKNNMSIKEKIDEVIRILWKYTSVILYETDKKIKINKANKGFKDAKLMIKENS